MTIIIYIDSFYLNKKGWAFYIIKGQFMRHDNHIFDINKETLFTDINSRIIIK